MDIPQALILFAAGCLASGINAVAGGGSLISFPTLIAFGLPELPANATNSVALWPGSLSSAIGFKDELKEAKDLLRLHIPLTLLGAGLGAWLLVSTPASAFKVAVPILILAATLLLAFQNHIKKPGGPRVSSGVAAFLQFLVAIYGGYFGAGMGILMLGVMGVSSEGDIHRHNGVKSVLAILINLVSSTILLMQGLVHLPQALALMAGAIAGGFLAARLSLKASSEALRKAIVVYGFGMAAWFAWRALAG